MLSPRSTIDNRWGFSLLLLWTLFSSGAAYGLSNHQQHLAKLLQSTKNTVRPSDLSQKSVIRENPLMNQYSAPTRREPIRMPSQTPMVPYKVGTPNMVLAV